MNRDSVTWQGFWSAPVTPFADNGAILLDSLESVYETMISYGIDGLVCNGSTGEWFTQTEAERKIVAERATAVAKVHSCPITIVVTSADTSEAIRLAQHAEQIGADAIMLSPPPMSRPTSHELFEYFSSITQHAEIPCWIYNFPQDNGRPISVTEICELAKLDNVVAVKQSTNSTEELIDTIRRAGRQIRVFGHLVSDLGAALIVSGFGGDGQVSSGCMLGAETPTFFDYAFRGEFAEASRIGRRYGALMNALHGPDFDGYNWHHGGAASCLKLFLHLQGIPAGQPRLPNLPVTDPAAISELRRIMKEFELL